MLEHQLVQVLNTAQTANWKFACLWSAQQKNKSSEPEALCMVDANAAGIGFNSWSDCSQTLHLNLLPSKEFYTVNNQMTVRVYKPRIFVTEPKLKYS